MAGIQKTKQLLDELLKEALSRNAGNFADTDECSQAGEILADVMKILVRKIHTDAKFRKDESKGRCEECEKCQEKIDSLTHSLINIQSLVKEMLFYVEKPFQEMYEKRFSHLIDADHLTDFGSHPDSKSTQGQQEGEKIIDLKAQAKNFTSSQNSGLPSSSATKAQSTLQNQENLESQWEGEELNHLLMMYNEIDGTKSPRCKNTKKTTDVRVRSPCTPLKNMHGLQTCEEADPLLSRISRKAKTKILEEEKDSQDFFDRNCDNLLSKNQSRKSDSPNRSDSESTAKVASTETNAINARDLNLQRGNDCSYGKDSPKSTTAESNITLADGSPSIFSKARSRITGFVSKDPDNPVLNSKLQNEVVTTSGKQMGNTDDPWFMLSPTQRIISPNSTSQISGKITEKKKVQPSSESIRKRMRQIPITRLCKKQEEYSPIDVTKTTVYSGGVRIESNSKKELETENSSKKRKSLEDPNLELQNKTEQCLNDSNQENHTFPDTENVSKPSPSKSILRSKTRQKVQPDLNNSILLASKYDQLPHRNDVSSRAVSKIGSGSSKRIKKNPCSMKKEISKPKEEKCLAHEPDSNKIDLTSTPPGWWNTDLPSTIEFRKRIPVEYE